MGGSTRYPALPSVEAAPRRPVNGQGKKADDIKKSEKKNKQLKKEVPRYSQKGRIKV